MSRKIDAKKVLAFLHAEEPPATLAERLGVSPEAVDEARCLLEEIGTAEVDAILAMPPALAPALLRAAAQAGREEALHEAALSPRKEIRKEAKRLAHHLRLQGKEVELPRAEAEAPSPAEAPAGPDLPVLLSPIDSEGQRAMVFTRRRGRMVEAARVVIDDERVLDFDAWETSRKKLRALVQELTEGKSALVEIPREEGMRQIDRVRFAMEERGGAPPAFATWALHALGPLPSERPPPLAPRAEGAAPENDAEREALARDSASLFEEAEVVSWVPEESFLRSLSMRIDEAQASPLYLPGPQGEAQRREAILAAVDREAERYFETRRDRYADWLSEAARLMEISGRHEAARRAASASARLREGVPAADVGFCLEFARRLVRKHPAFAEQGPSPIIT